MKAWLHKIFVTACGREKHKRAIRDRLLENGKHKRAIRDRLLENGKHKRAIRDRLLESEKQKEPYETGIGR